MRYLDVAGALTRRPPASLTSPNDFSAANRVMSRFSATPVTTARARVVSAPRAMWVNRSNSRAANRAFEANEAIGDRRDIMNVIYRPRPLCVRHWVLRSSDLQDDASLNFALSECAHRFRRLLERQHAIDARAHSAFSDEPHDPVRRLSRFIGKIRRPGAGEDADDRVVFQQGQIHRQRRDLASGESHRDEAAVPAHEAGKRQEHRPADIVDADIDAFAAGQGLHPFAYVLGRIVDDMLGAALPRNFSL